MLLSGTVTLVQESRFQLALDGGGTRLLVLARDAPLECPELRRLQRDRTPVVVRCRPNAVLIAAEAYALDTADDTAGAATKASTTQLSQSSGATP